MIEEIKDVHPNLHLHALAEVVVLYHAEVEVPIMRPNQSVAPETPKVLRARYTVTRCVERAGDLERREVQKAVRRVCAGKRISHQVRPAKEFTAAVEVAFKQIVDVERLAGGERQYAVDGPSRTQARHVT